MDRRVTRRDVIASTAATGVVFLAGCSDDGGGGDGDGGDDGGDGSAGGDDGSSGDDGTPAPAEFTIALETRTASDDVMDRFEELQVTLDTLTLTTSGGDTEAFTMGFGTDLTEADYEGGDRAQWGLYLPIATYEQADLQLTVKNHSLASEAAQLPLDGFESNTIALDDGSDTFTPTAGGDWRLTLVMTVRENDAGDAYVLEPTATWSEN